MSRWKERLIEASHEVNEAELWHEIALGRRIDPTEARAAIAKALEASRRYTSYLESAYWLHLASDYDNSKLDSSD